MIACVGVIHCSLHFKVRFFFRQMVCCHAKHTKAVYVSGLVKDELEVVADRLTQIADGVCLSSGDLETDGEEGMRPTQPSYLGCIH